MLIKMTGDLMKDKKRRKSVIPEFETLAILDAKKKTPETNISIPSQRAVEEAKEWVDENQK